MLDLWAREHYKSTIITFGKTLQDILASHGDDPLPEWKGIEPTFGIFSHTRPIAKGFMRQLKLELERNPLLKDWFPDILWDDPHQQAPKWSEDDGISVRRRSNPKEQTVEAWGLVDGQPISKHFWVMVYDDVVTRESVTTPDMIRKTLAAVEDSFNLSTEGGVKRFIGTRWHFHDCYKTLKDRGTAKVREHPGTEDGTATGIPVLWSEQTLREKRRDLGPYSFACQILLNPKADEAQGFLRPWIRYYKSVGQARTLNKYILVDAANSKKKSSDYTAMGVIGLGPDHNYYWLEVIRDRLSLTQRADLLFHLHDKWKPIEVRYEEYGLMADIEHIQYRQELENYRFDIVKVGGTTPKNDRIKRLVPVFEQGKFYLPRSQSYTDLQGVTHDIVRDFVEEEYAGFPVAEHDDMLDMLARLLEPSLQLAWPRQRENTSVDQMVEPLPLDDRSQEWMAG